MMNRKPKVALITRFVQDYRASMYSELEKRGNIDLWVIHSSKDLQEPSKPATGKYICKNSIEIKGFIFYVDKLKVILQPKVLQIIMQNQFDMVISESGRSLITSFLAMLLCKFKRIKFGWWTGSWEPDLYKHIDVILKKYQRFLWKCADGIIVYNKEGYQNLIASGISPKKIRIAQNTIDDGRILKKYIHWVDLGNKLRKSMGLVDRKVILFVGALAPGKRVDYLLDAFSTIQMKNNDAVLVIVGDGVERAHLEMLAHKLNIYEKTYFVGRKIDDVYAYFAMSDIFVLPGLGGLSINEAMLFKMPIVCCYADGSEKDLVENFRNGFVIDEASDIKKELEEKILVILGNTDLQYAMGEESFKKYFEVASYERLMQNIEDLINQTISSN